jgi:RNA polymerase sigma-70 factor (ECF subfamily)
LGTAGQGGQKKEKIFSPIPTIFNIRRLYIEIMSMEEVNINRQILERCRNGEVKAQFMLYKQYSKSMYNIAIRFLNNRMDAEDILQESFVTAFEKLGELANADSFGSWLKRIVINNCISQLRRNKFEFGDIEANVSIDDPDESEEDLSIDPAVVHNAIKELPPGGRTVLVLHALEGYKHREISGMLGISESTSKTQYKRALELLHKQLKHKIYVS